MKKNCDFLLNGQAFWNLCNKCSLYLKEPRLCRPDKSFHCQPLERHDKLPTIINLVS